MPIYEKCANDVLVRLHAVMEKYHGSLFDHEVTVDLLFAMAKTDENGDAVGPPLKKNGYPCAAIVRVNSHKDRVKGASDAEIAIDKEQWDELDDDERDALLDHELEHLELVTDKDGNLNRDDQDRPKLRLKPHERQVGWFDSVVRRHGKASLEYQAFDSIFQSTKQLNLPFVESIG